MTYVYKIEESGCPVACKYCVITKVDSRRRLWNKQSLIGINKAVTILNPPVDQEDKEASDAFYNFPTELFRSDIVGFNAISDPLWPKYQKELEYFLTKIAPIAKIATGVTKFNPTDAVLKRLALVPNFRLAISITGLDQLENTKTAHRLSILRRAKKFGVKAFPIIHPYIAGLSDLSFLPELKKMGYNEIDVKGLRYNHATMKNWMPAASQKYYRDAKEKEILPEDGWREKITASDLQLKSLKRWYQEEASDRPSLKYSVAEKYVGEILKYANITSSDTDSEVVKAAIARRLKNET